MEDETFVSEWFRTVWVTRRHMIHEQLRDLSEFEPMRLDLTCAERAVLELTEIIRDWSKWSSSGKRVAVKPDKSGA